MQNNAEQPNSDKFNVVKLGKGTIFNRLFLCFGAWLCFAIWILADGHEETIQMTVLITFGAVTVIWMLYEAIKKLVEDGTLNVNVAVGGKNGKA